MAVDAKGNSHKAAGRPDGGQFDGKAGQGSDDDLEVPTTAATVAPDEGWWASLENDPEAMAGPEPDVEPETPAELGDEKPDEGWWRSLEGDSKPEGEAEGDAESDDVPWWVLEEDDAPEVRKVRRIILDAHSREEAVALLRGIPMDAFRCAVIRSLPFEYKASVIGLTPDPDRQPDPFSLIEGLPYSADDAKTGRLRGLVAQNDVRAAVALAVWGDDEDRRWLASLPMAKRPVVGATLKVRMMDPEKRKAGDGTPAPEESDRPSAPTPKAESEKPKETDGAKASADPIKAERPALKTEGGPKPADPIADMAEKATHATNLWEARRLVSAQPQKTRVAVIRAMPFSRRALMADLAGDPDKARGYRSLLDMLPYTEDSPTDRLLDMANRGDVRAAAALAAYGSDDERRELKKLPVAGHRAVMMALDGHEPKDRRHAAPPTAPAAPALGPAAPKTPAAKSAPAPRTPGKASASQRPRYASNRTPRYSRPRRRTFRERMARGVAGLKSIWSGVWEKWAAVFKGRRSRP